MTLQFNKQYLNKTVNKSPRGPSERYLGILWHETASNGDANPHDTLTWNLKKRIVNGEEYASSYDFLIARSGEIFQYIDYHAFSSWDSGSSVWTFKGTTYRDWGVNTVLLGIELDGANNGVPCTQAQIDSAARLRLFLRDTEGIPIEPGRDVDHKGVAPGRKTDPRGYSVAAILTRARELDGTPTPVPADDRDAAWGPIPVNWAWGIPQRWDQERKAGRSLGRAVTYEVYPSSGYSIQYFEHGAIAYRQRDGKILVGRF